MAGEFRSREFDPEGGYGGGRWARDGDRWVVKETGVRPEGAPASSTRISRREGPDQVRRTLLDRAVGGAAVPGEESSLPTRVPPPPRSAAQPAGGADSAAPNSERSPR